MSDPSGTVWTEASPSLAVIKYWGKRPEGANIAATPSLAITLAGLNTRTAVRTRSGPDTVHLDGLPQPSERYSEFFENLRREIGLDTGFAVESHNSFPTAAGLASSSSGFAALTLGCCVAAGLEPDSTMLSRLARVGSGSAARAVYGGFTVLPAGAEAAYQVRPSTHWPELRVVIVTTTGKQKEIPSRDAMNSTRLSSPYYPAWIEDGSRLIEPAIKAVENRDIETLGRLTQLSYLRMFGTMISADPPILYWIPDSIGVIRVCASLRQNGVAAWETMDAGPQVKILTEVRDLQAVMQAIERYSPDLGTFVTEPGEGVRTVPEKSDDSLRRE